MRSLADLEYPADLAALLYHLGGEPFILPEGAGADLLQIGSLAALPVWSSAGPSAAAARQARMLARMGRPGLLLATDPERRRWTLAVSLQPVRLTVLSAGDIDALPLRRLARAAVVLRPTPLEQAIAFAEALDVDAAGRRTFRLLHELLERAVGLLPQTVARDDRHAWALAQITRLLFLRFVESEGWLDNNRRFLAETFDRCLREGRDPTRRLLHPLFFGTLNRPANQRSRYARSFGAIPFLNGGLFEQHETERRHRMHLPADYWRDAFSALVDRVDVTLDASVEDGRVTPELLGRVFEGVMHPLERRESGSFFTPPALVDAMVREALVCHLAQRVRQSEAAIEASLDAPDPAMLQLLLDVTVLDPAVGSGAFLVGALARLHGPGPRDPARVRFLVTRRLFGIDRHPGAVRLCELRLWLEVLRAMRGRAPSMLPPLPNLDAAIRAGDALIDPLGRQVTLRTDARRIAAAQRTLLRSHSAAKRVAQADARRAERAVMIDALKDQEERLDATIMAILSRARAPTLFGDRSGATPASRRELADTRRQRRQVRMEHRRLLRDATATPFALAAAFAPVMTRRGGFDLVAANPPWVRAERLTQATRDALSAGYRWWRGGANPGWRHLPDLSVAFIERGFQLLAPGGTLVFLAPSKLMTAGYAGACRAALVAQSTIHRVADLGNDTRAGFEATTYPFALITSRRAPSPDHQVRLGLTRDAPSQPQACWDGAAPWLVAPPVVQRLVERLRHQHPVLGDGVRPQLGVKTGFNNAFLAPPEELHQWCRPAVRGRDVQPFTAAPRLMLLWPADARGVPWKQLPAPVAAHLDAHLSRLQRRADQLTGPWWQLFRTTAATARHRVIWRDLAPELQAAVLTDPAAVPLNSCYVAAMRSSLDAATLAAWLNATPIRVLCRLGAEPAAGGCARFASRVIAALPLPRCVLGDPILAELTSRAADHNIQQELDDRVAHILGLSRNEQEMLRGVAADRR